MAPPTNNPSTSVTQLRAVPAAHADRFARAAAFRRDPLALCDEFMRILQSRVEAGGTKAEVDELRLIELRIKRAATGR